MRLINCPECHQDKAHHARGMCQACYRRARLIAAGHQPAADRQCATDGCPGLVRAQGRETCLGCFLAPLGLSYRQLDFWVRRGWLKPDGGNGSGRQREWPPAELDVAARMARLIGAGWAPERAAAFARDSWPRGEIAPGIVVEVTS